MRSMLSKLNRAPLRLRCLVRGRSDGACGEERGLNPLMEGACEPVALLQSLTVLGKLDVKWPAVVGKLVLSAAVQSRCT